MSGNWRRGPLVLGAALAFGIFVAYDNSRLYQYQAAFSGSYTYNLLFNSGVGVMLVSAGLGILAGAAEALFGRKTRRLGNGDIASRGAPALLDDWGIAVFSVGVFVQMATGLALGGIWSPRLVMSVGATAFTMNMHFIGIMFMVAGGMCVTTRMAVSRDFSTLTSARGVFSRSGGRHLRSYTWAVSCLACAALALAFKGTLLMAVHLLHMPIAMSIVAAVVHDLLALAVLVLGLVATVLALQESRPAVSRGPAASLP